MKDYYEVLEVHPKASQEIIRKAYITLAKKYHPDTTSLEPNYAKQKMQEINEAYEVLADKKKRAEYDKEFTENKGYSTTEDIEDTDTMSSEIKFAQQHLMEICNRYIEILNVKIRKDIAFIENNQKICKPLLNEFYKEIEEDYKFLIYSDELKGDIADVLAITLYSFAINLTWCNDFVEAVNVLNMALNIVDADSDVHKKIYEFKKEMEKEAIKQKSSELEKKHTDNKLLKKIILLIIVLFGVFLYSCHIDPSINMMKDSKPSSKISQQQNTNDTQTKVILPRANIKTGYDKSHKILNNTGLCELTIDNTKNKEPVYVRLWTKTPNVPVRAFYIAARDSFTLRKLNADIYELRYKYLYQDKDAEQGVKSETFELKQYEDYNGVRYSITTITLYKVSNGNFESSSINANDI